MRERAFDGAVPVLPPIHVIDFEGNKTYGIMEYAIVTLRSGRIEDPIFARCCAFSHIGETKILTEHSRFGSHGGVNFSEHLPLFLKKRKEGIFCAHNASTEDRLLRKYRSVPGIAEGSNLLHPRVLLSWGPWIDTYRIYRKYYPSNGGYSVSNLVSRFEQQGQVDALMKTYSITENRFHRASYDAIATAVLLKIFIDAFTITDVRFLFV